MNQTIKKDELLSKIVNIGVVVLFFIIVIIIYQLFFNRSKQISKFEHFTSSGNETIYETSLKKLYFNNSRLLCSMLPTTSNICSSNGGESYIIYNFPIHMIKLADGNILSVFNNGRLYKKDDMFNTMWQGPLINSLPNDSIPLRMITLTPSLNTLLGVGFDNKLYMKQPDENGNLNLDTTWRLVPNNSNIIYVLFDNDTGYLLSIDINGQILTKSSSDIASPSTELLTKVNKPILRLYLDMNGYMLAIDDKFDLYQFSELNWKNSPLNTQRGANKSKVHDLLYHNDGRMFGLIFNPDKYMVQLMKQDQAFYLGDFTPFENHINLMNNNEFVMSDQDIIRSKVGNIKIYLETIDAGDAADNDPNIAYQKQILETKGKLRQFCKARGNATNSNSTYDNYDLLANVEQNDEKISNMKTLINTLLTYEPDKKHILERTTL